MNCLKTIPFTAAHTYIAHIWQSPPDLRLSPNQARPWRSFTKFLPPSQRKSHSLRIPTRRRRDQNIEPVPGVQIARPPPSFSPRFPGVQFNSLPTHLRALLSERLEQAKLIHHTSDSRMRVKALEKSDLDAKRLESNCQVSHETTNFTVRYQQGKQRNKS